MPTRLPRERLRICLVVEATFAGVGRHALDLAEGLRVRGHDVHLVYSPVRSEPAWTARLDPTRYATHPVPMGRSISWRDASAAVAVRRYLRRHGPFDVVHGHSSKGGAVARLGAADLPLKVVYTAHAFAAMDPTGSNRRRFVYRALECVLARLTDAIICVSPEEMEFAQSIGIPSAKLRVIPNGVEPLPPVDPAAARAELGLAPGSVVIGFVGRLSPQKAPDVLLRAFARIADQFPAAVLAVIGEGFMAGPLAALTAELGVGQRVKWLGWRDGKRAMRAFDVLALPSSYEGFPYVALEALSAGLPVVTTSAAGCRLLVTHGRNGWIVPPGRPDLLADALTRVIGDPTARSLMGTASSERAGDFQLDQMVNATIAVYRSFPSRQT